jgi:hypothetical protein
MVEPDGILVVCSWVRLLAECINEVFRLTENAE